MLSHKQILVLGAGLMAVSITHSVSAAVWTKNYNVADYNAYGTITLDDWGYAGPGGRNAQNFEPINGFGKNSLDPYGGVGQIQHVVTTGADGLTPDPTSSPVEEWGGAPNSYVNANMDSRVNFYNWAYDTKAGSNFQSMKIDYDGDYFVAQNDMNFEWYNTFTYEQVIPAGGTRVGTVADGIYETRLAFQPYALSDAKGWCGSVMADNPASLEAMAGQVVFDFAFDVYVSLGGGSYSYMSTEIVRGFEMRSWGDISVNVAVGGADGFMQSYTSRAVVNNTNPTINNATVGKGTPTDLDYYNLVSFQGADVIPTAGECGVLTAAYAGGARGPGVEKFASLMNGVADEAACTTAGGAWQTHAFSGYAFILRADGIRVIEAVDYSAYPVPSDPGSNVPPYITDGVVYNYDENGALVPIANIVPVPAAVWLFGSGLVALTGVARRRKYIRTKL